MFVVNFRLLLSIKLLLLLLSLLYFPLAIIAPIILVFPSLFSFVPTLISTLLFPIIDVWLFTQELSVVPLVLVILNPILAETDYVNYTYQGVSLQDIVVKEKEEAKQPEINANKEDEILDENEDSKTSTTSTSSVESWLKEMGINS